MIRKSQLLFTFLAALLCGCAIHPPAAKAQFIGYTSPQSVQNVLAAPGTVCTGSAQTFPTMNLGQTQHTAILIFSGTVGTASMQILATDTSNHTFPISNTVQAGALFNGVSAIATASNYYPLVSVQVTCTAAATFTLTYSGTSSTPPVVSGTQFLSLLDQQIFSGISGSSNQISGIFQAPFANSSGTLRFKYESSAVAGGSVALLCISTASNTGMEQFTYLPANTTSVQLFHVPPASCPFAQIIYVFGGAAGPIDVEWVFDNQGMIPNPTLGAYAHITGTTATVVKTGFGTLAGVSVNTSAAGTVSVFDLTSTACTGTPSTNIVAVITALAASQPFSLPYNVQMSNGICVKASAAMDITVSSQ